MGKGSANSGVNGDISKVNAADPDSNGVKSDIAGNVSNASHFYQFVGIIGKNKV